jgi:hypothetical protein
MTDPRSLPESSRDALAEALRYAGARTKESVAPAIHHAATTRTGDLAGMTFAPQLGDAVRGALNGAVKQDAGKARWDLLPFDSLGDVAAVMTHGADKYGASNWTKGLAWGRLLAATMRHLSAWALGTERDTDSGLPHLAHAGACILMLGALVRRGVGVDDRCAVTGGAK